MANIFSDIANFFKKVLSWLEGAEKALAPVLDIAENLLNGLKNFEASPAGQTVEALIESIVPASTGLINAVKLQLPVWLKDLGWVKDETNKTLDEQWADAQAYLASIVDPNVRATQLNALKSLFTHFFATNTGATVNGQQFTIQQALVLAQPSHDPSIVDPAN
jgi:hypothetical protein